MSQRTRTLSEDGNPATHEQGYVQRVAAMPPGKAAYDPPDGPYRFSHVLLNRTVALPPCGCDVDGYGTIPRPAVIRFCPTHAAAPDMLASLKNAAAALAVISTGVDDAAALKAFARQAFQEARTLLATLDENGG